MTHSESEIVSPGICIYEPCGYLEGWADKVDGETHEEYHKRKLLFDQVVNEARRELTPFVLLWREKIQNEVLEHLQTLGYLGSILVANEVVKYIDQYGCSIEKATSKIMTPDTYWNPPDEYPSEE